LAASQAGEERRDSEEFDKNILSAIDDLAKLTRRRALNIAALAMKNPPIKGLQPGPLSPTGAVTNSPPKSAKEETHCSGMSCQLKPIFDSLRPIIERHVEMKPLLFDKVLEWRNNPNLSDLVPVFTALFEAYDNFCSVYESRKSALKDALLKKKSDLVTLAQQFEEIHMISVENFLIEVSTKAVHIYTMLSEVKQYTLPLESDFNNLEELCANVEKINEKNHCS